MDQSINIRIAGQEYALKAKSAEHERTIREAAEIVNHRLDVFGAKYPDVSLENKLAYILLGETVSRLSAQRELASARKEVSELLAQTDSYLQKAE